MYSFKFIHINKFYFDLMKLGQSFNHDDVTYTSKAKFIEYANDKIEEFNANTGKGVRSISNDELDNMINNYKEGIKNRFVLYSSEQELLAVIINKVID